MNYIKRCLLVAGHKSSRCGAKSALMIQYGKVAQLNHGTIIRTGITCKKIPL